MSTLDQFLDNSSSLEAHEKILYNCIDRGIDTYIRALAGILVVNGIGQLLAAGSRMLESEQNSNKKNNLFFFMQGMDILSSDNSDFCKALNATKKSYARCNITARAIGDFSGNSADWIQKKDVASDILGEFRGKCKSSFGLMSVFKTNLNWSELIDKMIIAPECFDKEFSDLCGDISCVYISNQIPDGLDVSALSKCVINLRQKVKFFHQFISDLESNRIQLSDDLQSIRKRLLENLPETAKRALFRIYHERFQEEESLYPSLFKLHNLDEEVIAILDGNISMGQLGHSEQGA